ncbi:hypothetical protein M5689_010486 [Euphorbia peplus]|nr:hypothetical protein M5689_010486 [Euphorbia peplus]
MYKVVHVDEKWFFLSQLTQKYYLLLDEEDPYRYAQSNRYINKGRFLTDVGRPRIRASGEVDWDGKIGIFPFTYEKPAERCSINRLAGKWPTDACKMVWVQQDNARPHITSEDIAFTQAAEEIMEEASKYLTDGIVEIHPNQHPTT